MALTFHDDGKTRFCCSFEDNFDLIYGYNHILIELYYDIFSTW
jgi:hypothetical protein